MPNIELNEHEKALVLIALSNLYNDLQVLRHKTEARTGKPDIARCTDLSAVNALQEKLGAKK